MSVAISGTAFPHVAALMRATLFNRFQFAAAGVFPGMMVLRTAICLLRTSKQMKCARRMLPLRKSANVKFTKDWRAVDLFPLRKR
jgi:hypothetical protein